MSHTPGPWKWHGDWLESGAGGGLSTVLDIGDDGKPYGMHLPVLQMDNPEFDKPLIAAAPDLLAALESVKECLLSSSWKDGGYTIIASDMSVIGEKIEAAIRKAKGTP